MPRRHVDHSLVHADDELIDQIASVDGPGQLILNRYTDRRGVILARLLRWWQRDVDGVPIEPMEVWNVQA